MAYLEVTEISATQHKLSEDNFTAGNSPSRSYKLTVTPQRVWIRLHWDLIKKLVILR